MPNRTKCIPFSAVMIHTREEDLQYVRRGGCTERQRQTAVNARPDGVGRFVSGDRQCCASKCTVKHLQKCVEEGVGGGIRVTEENRNPRPCLSVSTSQTGVPAPANAKRAENHYAVLSAGAVHCP
jgi:hypothetical protein